MKEGKWNHFNPRKVRVPVLRWMEKDASRVSHWFDMEPETYLLGVEIRRAERSFVYIVTRKSVGDFQQIHDRIPLIVGRRSDLAG